MEKHFSKARNGSAAILLAVWLAGGSIAAAQANPPLPKARVGWGIWVDPDGCQTSIIDDGAEGRATRRRNPVSGRPVGAGTPGYV